MRERRKNNESIKDNYNYNSNYKFISVFITLYTIYNNELINNASIYSHIIII